MFKFLMLLILIFLIFKKCFFLGSLNLGRLIFLVLLRYKVVEWLFCNNFFMFLLKIILFLCLLVFGLIFIIKFVCLIVFLLCFMIMSVFFFFCKFLRVLMSLSVFFLCKLMLGLFKIYKIFVKLFLI